MTREEFKMLFKLTDSDSGMEFADEEVANGSTYFEVAKRNIATLTYLANKGLANN